MKKEIYVAMALSAVLVLLLSGGVVWAQPKKLTVGYMGALQGPGAQWGRTFERGCALAVEEVNAKGGITVGGANYTLEQKSYDHAYDPSRSVEIAKRMMKMDKVAWIICQGGTCAKPVIPFTEEAKVILMSGGTGTDIMIFSKQNYTYRFITTCPEGNILTWQWVSKNHPEWKTTVELQPDDASGWDVLADIRERILPKLGVKILAETFYRRGITDFYPILVKFLALKPDVFDLSVLPPADAGRVIKQAREMGYKGPFIYPIGASNAPTLEIAGAHAEGLIFGSSISPTSGSATPEEKAYYQRWIKAYGEPYDLNGIEATYSTYSVAQALEKANSFDPDKVTKAIQTSEFIALGRKLRWGGASHYGPPPRQVITNYGIFVVEKGERKMIDVVQLPAEY